MSVALFLCSCVFIKPIVQIVLKRCHAVHMHANSYSTPKCGCLILTHSSLYPNLLLAIKMSPKMMVNWLLGFVAKLKIIGPITFVPKAKMSFVLIPPYVTLGGNNLYLCNVQCRKCCDI